MADRLHQPVMLEQVLDLLQPRPGGTYLDLTVGAGGHARSILERSAPDGRVLAFDRDPEALAVAGEELGAFGKRFQLHHLAFTEVPEFLRREGLDRVDGLLADLGVSSIQLDRAERGFSFQRSGPLDMRMDPSRGETLAECLAGIDLESLADRLRRFGEVDKPRKVARRIMQALAEGRVTNTLELARVASERSGRKKHPATRVFMALRMMINDELGQLEAILRWLPAPLKPGGRAVFISFHSLEDRAVKRRFVALEGRCICPPGLPDCGCGQLTEMKRVNRRSIRAGADELVSNPRARSARLRAAERVSA